LRDELAEEVPANGSLPLWRRDSDAGALALRITKEGLTATLLNAASLINGIGQT
jgi:hypothetical protein